MKISTEHLPRREVLLTIQPDDEQVDRALRKAANKIGNRYTVPGFRKGKAPYAAIMRAYGKEAIYEQAAEDMADQVLKEALEQTGLDPVGPVHLENMTFDPLVYTIKMPLEAEVSLGDYRSLRIEFTAPTLNEAEVEKALDDLRRRESEWTPVENEGAGYGDLVAMKLHGYMLGGEAEDAEEEVDEEMEPGDIEVEFDEDEFDEDEFEEDDFDEEDDSDDEDDWGDDDDWDDDDELIEEDNFELVLNEEPEGFPPGFDAQFLSAQAGNAFDFVLTYPEDWENSFRAGRSAHFVGEILSVKRQALVEIDDDFAAQVSEFSTLDELRESIRTSLLKEKNDQEDHRYMHRALNALKPYAKLDYPEVYVDNQVQGLIGEYKARIRRAGLPYEEYMRLTGMTEDKIAETMRPEAVESVERELMLEKLEELEQITAEQGEIDARVEAMLSEQPDDASWLEFLSLSTTRHMLGEQIARNKVLQRLVAIAKGEAPELTPAEATLAETSLES